MLTEEEILSTYTWLTKDLFKRIIRKDYPNAEVEVKDFSAPPALEPGENYTTTMIRPTVHYVIDGDKLEKRFIIKAAHYKKELREFLQGVRLFKREFIMYGDIIPKAEQLLADIGDNSKLAAKCYEINDNPDDPYIIFEDLTSREYKNIDRRIGLDISHFKKSLSKIAKWHATNAVLLELKDYPILLKAEEFTASEEIKSLTFNSLKAVHRLVKEMTGLEHLSDKIINSYTNICTKMTDLTKDSDQSFMTLCHGDLWMNNIMYKHDKDGLPIDALLCDYQAPRKAPAVLDVINHLYSSSQENIKDREWDILVQHYHRELSTTLKKLNYSKRIPTLTDIQIEVLEKSVCNIGITLFSSSARVLENTGQDLATFFSDSEEAEEQNYHMMANPKCRKTLEFLIDFMDRKGYFE